MTPQEAAKIFAAHGVEAANLEEAELHRAWLRVARRVHPDHGGGHDDAAVLNAAYIVLREEARAALAARAAQRAEETLRFRDPLRNGVAVWAWAGAGTTTPSDRIERASYSDRNFVKRRLWELSGGGTDEWTIWPFDGNSFLTPLTAYASPELFREMAVAANHFAREGFRQPLAVLSSRPRDRFEANLIALRGKPLDRPERMAVVGDPRADPGLIRALRDRIG